MITSNAVRFASLMLLLGSSLLAAQPPSIELVSKPSVPRPRSFGDSGDLSLSADGKWAVFTSSGNGLVTNVTDNMTLNVYLRNNETGEISLISKRQAAPGKTAAHGNSYAPRISADGSFVVFETEAENLFGPADDEDEGTYALLFSRLPNSSEGVLIGPLGREFADMTGTASGAPVISPDGRFLLFETDAAISELDNNDSVDLYLISTNSQIQLVTTRSNSLDAASISWPSSIVGTFEASMSADARHIAFISSATNHAPGLPANAAPQIYLRNMVVGTNAWLTRSSLFPGSATIVGSPRVSTNSLVIFFLSSALESVSPPPATGDTFLYAYYINTGQRVRVGGTPSIHAVSEFDVSDDGSYVALSSSNQIFLHHRPTGTNYLVSRTPEGQPSSGVSAEPAISADGRFVVFTSTATNLAGGSTNGLFQTYVFDRDSDEVSLLSRNAFAGGDTGANSDTLFPSISADGSTVGFMTYASNLTTNDNPLSNDLFLVSSSGRGAVTLASVPHPLSISATPAGQSYVEAQAISLDGRFVVFTSEAPDVVPNDTNSTRDIFLRDLQTGTTTLISRQPDGTLHPGQSTFLAASMNLEAILYSVNELDSGGALTRKLYLFNRATSLSSVASILPDGSPANTFSQALLSPDGRLLAFRELTAATSPLYLRDLSTGVTTQYIPNPTLIGTEPLVISPSGDFLLTKHVGSTYALHDLTQRSYITNITSSSLIAQPFSANGSMLISTGHVLNAQLQLRSLHSSNDPILISTNGTPLAISLDGTSAAYSERDGTNFYLYIYNVATGESSPLMQGGTNVPLRIRPGSTFSADGRFFAFVTTTSLTTVDHSFNKLYIYDTVLETVRLAASSDSAQSAAFGVGNPSISANGRVVAYDTFSANLVPDDINLASDVFVSRFSPVDTDNDGLEDGWETIYLDGLSDAADTDSDNDGISNLDEFRAGTDPNNSSSILSLEFESDGDTLNITSPASPGLAYQLEYCSDLSNGGWQPVGLSSMTFSNSITFAAPVELEGHAFFRIRATH